MCGSITCATCTTHLPRPRYVRTPHKLPNSHSPSSTGSAKKQTEKAIFWNFWVLLALPWNWLAWSVLSVIVAIMTFVWRTGASTLSAHARDIYQYHVLARPRPCVTETRRGNVLAKALPDREHARAYSGWWWCRWCLRSAERV